MTNRLNLYWTAKLAVVAGLMFLAPGLASAQEPRCSILTGTYALLVTGTYVPPGSTTPIPFNVVGIWTFDGVGKWTATERGNFGLSVLRSVPFSGTYTLNPDCTGTSTAKLPDGSLGQSDFVVTDGGKTIYGISVANVAPGNITTTIATKIPMTW